LAKSDDLSRTQRWLVRKQAPIRLTALASVVGLLAIVILDLYTTMVTGGTAATFQKEVLGDLPFLVLSLVVLYYILSRYSNALQKAQVKTRYEASLVDSVSDAIMATDLNLAITSWNRGAEKMYGWTAGEALGKNVIGFLKTEFPDTTLEDVLARLSKERSVRGEVSQVCKDGRTIDVRGSTSALMDADERRIGYANVCTDITEARHAEMELRSVAAFPEENPMPVLRLMADGTVAYSNGAGREILKVWGCGVGGVAPESWRERVKEALAEKASRVVEEGYGLVVYSFSVCPVPEFGYVNLYAFDVTERKKAEEDLARRSKLYWALSESNQAIVRAADREELFREVCDVLVRSELFVLAWVGFVDPETRRVRPALWAGHEDGLLGSATTSLDGASLDSPIASAIREGKPFVCNDVTTDPWMFLSREEALKRGYRSSAASPLMVRGEVAGSLFVYSEIPSFFGEEQVGLMEEVSMDLSYALEGLKVEEEKGRVLEALRTSEEKYRELVERANSIILKDDLQGRIISFNEYAERFFGFDREEVIGKGFFETITPPVESTGRDLTKLVTDVVAHPEEYRTNVNENVKKSGERVWIQWSNSVIKDEQGKPTGVLCVGTDITELRKMEEKLMAHSASLEDMVEARTAELEETHRVLLESERLAAIGRVSTQLAHDLRNPLAGIEMESYLLNELLPKSLDPRVKDTLRLLSGSADHAGKVIEDLLEYTRVQEPRRQQLELGACIADVVAAFPIPKGVSLVVKKAPKVRVLAEQGQLVKVVRSLLDNAVEAMPSGGRLIVSFGLKGGLVSISVADTGVGIDKADLPKVFLPFHSTKAKGLGLGLPIAKRMIEANGGSMELKSTKGKGTKVTVMLPIASETPR
jgi:PAS domain S-box-containing protein